MLKKLSIGFLVIFTMMFYASNVNAEQNPDDSDMPTTGFEKSDGDKWTTHSEELDFLEEVTEQSDRVTYSQIGTSGEGRPLHLVRVGFPSPPTDEDLINGRKMLIMGTPHGNEPAGREMALQLLRNLAFTQDQELLDQLKDATILIIPSQNPDGSASNKRFTTEGVDLNQDRINLRTGEGQAIAKVINEFKPEIIVSSHEKLRSPPDISMLWPTNLNVDETLRDLNIEMVEEYIRPNVESAGYSTGLYNGIASEWNLRNMGGLQHSLTVLYESGRDGVPTDRVKTQLLSSESVLKFYRENFEEIKEVTEGARERKEESGKNQSEPFYVEGDEEEGSTILDPPPCGYLLNSSQAEKIEKHMEAFSIESQNIGENAVFIPMNQPMMTIIPQLLDERANNHEVAGLAVFDCSKLDTLDPPTTPEPVQYKTDFSEYEAGKVPNDWSMMWMDSDWTILNEPRRLEHRSFGNQGARRGLAFDKTGEIYGDVEVSAVVRAREGGLSRFQLGINMNGTKINRTQNNYYIDVFGSKSPYGVRINRYKNGSFKLLKRTNLPFEVKENEWYQVVMQREGNSIRAKVWPFGEDEPTSWQVTAEDQFIQHGKVGFLHLTDGVINDWAFFGVGTLGKEAPRAPENLFDPKVDKSELQELIEDIEAEDLEKVDYTEGSWDALEDAIERANAVLSSEDATQSDVDGALEALTTAYEGLEKTDKTSKDALQEKVDEIKAEELVESQYTGESWKAFQTALRISEELLIFDKIGDSIIDKALNNLQLAYEELTEK